MGVAQKPMLVIILSTPAISGTNTETAEVNQAAPSRKSYIITT